LQIVRRVGKSIRQEKFHMRERQSKIRTAERLMTRPEGATMDEILAATGGSYQYNAKRRLEARGFRIRTRKEGRVTRYWAEAPHSRAFDTTLTSKGQITVPREVRDTLRLRNGQKLRFTIEDDKRVVIAPIFARLSELAGVLPKATRTVSLEEMNEAVQRAAVRRYRRTTKRTRR
jgi:AbrB family looped-hinge helix DNA binding protein